MGSLIETNPKPLDAQRPGGIWINIYIYIDGYIYTLHIHTLFKGWGTLRLQREHYLNNIDGTTWPIHITSGRTVCE